MVLCDARRRLADSGRGRLTVGRAPVRDRLRRVGARLAQLVEHFTCNEEV